MSRKEVGQTETQETERLVASVQGGRTEDYAAIVEHYQRPIFIYCCRLLGDEQEAEDAAQDIFVRAYERIRQYRPTVGFAAWLYKIAYRHCLNLLRRRRVQRRTQWLFKPAAAADSPEQIVDRRSFSPPLDAALRSLSAHERSLLVLSVFEERTYAEIAAIVGKHPEAVKKRIGRAKQKVRDRMGQERSEEEWHECSPLLKTKS